MTKDITLLIALEAIMIDKMREIRGLRVMLDIDLAELYEVRVNYLRRQVTRNIDRFPEDFMFRLTRKELESSKTGQLPYAFTEKGILMAGGVLDSERAIKVHIQLVCHFVQLYKETLSNNLLLEERAPSKKCFPHITQIFAEKNTLNIYSQYYPTPDIFFKS